MNGEAMEWLAAFLSSGRSGGGTLVLGQVLSLEPFRVLAEGLTQDAEDLLRSDSLEVGELLVGDLLALWPIEERQRYVILCKVVSL